MSLGQGKRKITVVTACMNANGAPDFGLTEIEVTQQEAENGVHYDLAEAQLLDNGYEEPMVHYDEGEAPAFLHTAVRHYLGLSFADPAPTVIVPSEEQP